MMQPEISLTTVPTRGADEIVGAQGVVRPVMQATELTTRAKSARSLSKRFVLLKFLA